MKKVLFPSESIVDFAKAGGPIGWVPIDNINSLKTMAENIVATDNVVKDHAIPSPIAYIKDFRKRLADGNESAVNEWRGMLAAIALQKIKSLNITIEEIPLWDDPTGTGTPTKLGSIICDALTESADITGYTYELIRVNDGNGRQVDTVKKDSVGNFVPEYKSLAVFCKDGVPFAMFMPGMVICPFKEYPTNLFAGLDWYDDVNGKWLPMRDSITTGPNLTSTAQKLYFWVNSLYNNHQNINFLADFEKYLLDTCPVPAKLQRYEPVLKDYNEKGKVWNEIKCICPPSLDINVFSNKIFLIIPPADMFTGTRAVNGEQISCAIDHPGCFTPKSMLENNKPYYIVPPIHHDVVDAVRGGKANLTAWNVIPETENGIRYYKSTVTLFVPEDSDTLSYTKKYLESEVAWTSDLPYISMWPFVNFSDDSWKEHYVSVWPDVKQQGRRLADYKDITMNPNYKHVVGVRADGTTNPTININLAALNAAATVETCKCHSGFGNKDFTMLRSSSQPYALEFSYDDAGVTYTIGSWVIDRRNAIKVDSNTSQKTYYIAMDFGTTSTNVYLREDNAQSKLAGIRSISSAGKFLCELYNPYITSNNVNAQVQSDHIQNYYLFSNSRSPLGKIFTYGQNFTTSKDGIPLGNTESNISGRAVVVDESFIIDGIGDSNNGILNGLKIRSTLNPNLVSATNNFVCNILTYAVLEAKANGANAIKLRVSYPGENFANVLKNIGNIVNDLSYKCGINIELGGVTEARAAGEYFAKCVNGPDAPVPKCGYAIIDIGGGTTDFSFWKQEANDVDVMQKNEHSFGYAGNYLVTKTIIQAIKSDSEFTKMWSFEQGTPIAKAIDKYKAIALSRPVGNNLTSEYLQKASTLDFLLEKCQVNNGMLSQGQYNDFLSAIRMKYFALFYLIANYIKSKTAANGGKINISENNFRICLAGCGSKGMNLCRQGAIGGNFDQNLNIIFEDILGITQPGVFSISKPRTDNKEEVVIGLTIIDNAKPMPAATAGGFTQTSGPRWGNNTPSAVNTAEEQAAVPASERVHLTQDGMMQAYSALMEMLKYFEKDCSSDLCSKIDINTSFEAKSYFIQMSALVEQQLEDSNYDKDTYAENFALLMLENMIDNFI